MALGPKLLNGRYHINYWPKAELSNFTIELQVDAQLSTIE